MIAKMGSPVNEAWFEVPSDRERLMVAPLTLAQASVVDGMAQFYSSNRNNVGISFDDSVKISEALVLSQLGVGDLLFSENNGLHIHLNPGPLDSYYTCLRCYGD